MTMVRYKAREAAAAEHSGDDLPPRGFSFAHLPAGFLWNLPRVGALRLVYRKAGNPDFLLLVGPNWNFAIFMFFLQSLVIAFFLNTLGKGLEEGCCLFAGGAVLCFLTFAFFFFTVFKNPGLPLNVFSSAQMHSTLLALTMSPAQRKRLNLQPQRRALRWRRLAPRSLSAKSSVSGRKLKNVVVSCLTVGKGGKQRRTSFLSENDEAGPCSGRLGSSYRSRAHCFSNNLQVTVSRGLWEQRGRILSDHGSLTGSSETNGGSSSEGSEADSQRRGSRSDRSSSEGSDKDTRKTIISHTADDRVRDDGKDVSDSSNIETVSERASETENLDELGSAANGVSESGLCGKNFSRFVRSERFSQGIYLRLARSERRKGWKKVSAEVVPRTRVPLRQQQPQVGTALAAGIGGKTDGLHHILPCLREESREISALSVMRDFPGRAVKLRKLPSSFTSMWRRPQGGKPRTSERLFARNFQQYKSRIGYGASLRRTLPSNSSSNKTTPQSSHSPQFPAFWSYGMISAVNGLNGRRIQQFSQTRELTASCAEEGSVDFLYSRFCVKCKIAPPPGSYHCEECRVCIEGYDHHCPWTSKCVGKGNRREFYAWVLFSLVTVFYFGVATMLLQKDNETHAPGAEIREASHTDATAPR